MDVMERDDEFVALLRRTLDAKASELAIEPGPLIARSGRAAGVRRQTLVAVAAAALVVGGAGGIISVRLSSDGSTGATTPAADGVVAATPAANAAASDVEWFLPSVLPDGYELAEIEANLTITSIPRDATLPPDVMADLAPLERQHVWLVLESVDGDRPPVRVEVATAGAHDEAPADETRTVDGVEYRIAEVRTAEGQLSERIVTAERDDRMLIVRSEELSAGELVEVAAGLRPATPQEAAAAATTISRRTLTFPLYATATLEDGTVVSMRTEPSGALALCVEQPTLTCRRAARSPSGISAPLRVEIVTIDDGPHVLAWYGGTSDVGLADPSPGEPSRDMPLEVVAADRGPGTFVVVPLVMGPPTLVLYDDHPMFVDTAEARIHP